MTPQFPDFKRLEVDDREVVEAHTRRYDPYSDFNFTSLWTWDTSGSRMISELNGNLIVRFTDYSTDEPFLSFLGTNECQGTALTLLNYSKQNNLPAILKLIPEVSISKLDDAALRVEEDRHNYDYICSAPRLAALAGGDFKRSRNFVNTFKREYPSALFEVVDLADAGVQRDILEILDVWERNKVERQRSYEIKHEKDAIRRLFSTTGKHTLIVMAVFVNGIMCAFSIDELLPAEHGIIHFQKADIAYKGIYDFLIQEKAKHFEALGIVSINFEQDLGIEGLRLSKVAYRPTHFLKKYRVTARAAS